MINAIAPPALPDARPTAAVDPVYSLVGGQNQARPYQPVPLVLGQHRMFPDLSAAPYNRYEGQENDQYLYTAFNFGLGIEAQDVDDLKVGGTLLTALAPETSWANDLLDGDVATVAGADLTDETVWTQKAVAAGAESIELDFAARAFRVGSDGSFLPLADPVRIMIEVFATVAGSSEPRRLQYQFTLNGDSPTPVRSTWQYTLLTDDPQPADGQTWQVRCRRAAEPSDDDSVHDDVSWQAMRSIQPDETNYSGQGRLSLKLRATDQLSGTLDRLSATASQRVPVWDGTAWTAPQRSSNPAWIFRWFARGLRIGGRLVAGAGLPDERIDDDSLKRWGAWCDAPEQQLSCNHVLTAQTSVHDVLALIAQCGRASPTWAAGRLGVVFEDADRLPTALITPGNIVAGTLEIDYAGGPQVDEVAVSYISPALDWQLQTLRRRAAGVTTPAHTATVRLPGVTNDRQAAVAANLLLAAQTWRRRRIRWQMGPAALTQIHRGDVVWLSHSLLDGGDTGRLARIEGAVVTLDRKVEVANGDHVLFMLPDSAMHATTVAGNVGIATKITLAAALPAPGAGNAPWNPADVLWRLYPAADPPTRARILSVEPQSEDVVRLTAVDDPTEYHAAATADLTLPDGAVPAVPPSVVSVFAWTELVDTAAGEAALVHVGIEVAGRWRGGDVVVSTQGGPQRVPKGRIGEIDRTLAWIAPTSARLTIHVIPLGNPGGGRTLEDYDVDGPSSVHVLRFRGNWMTGTAYKIGDVVAYEERSYTSNENHVAADGNRPSGQDTSNTTWTLFAAKGATGAPGRNGRPGTDGTDGNGYEYIYARSARDFVIRSTDKPLRTWRFDQVGAAGIQVGRLRWHDGDPGRSASKPRAWFAWRHARGNPPNPSLINGGRWSEPVILVEDGQDATPPAPYITHSGDRGCVRFGTLQICMDNIVFTGAGRTRTYRFDHAFRQPPFMQIFEQSFVSSWAVTTTTLTLRTTTTPGGDDPQSGSFRYVAWGIAAAS